MAVFTSVNENELRAFLKNYDLGELQSYEGIEQGVSNTNYHVFTDKGRYILTLFEERTSADDLPFFFAFKEHLAKYDIACPLPVGIKNKDGKIVGTLCSRPAAFNSFLEGTSVEEDDIAERHCKELGQVIARMHLAAQSFSFTRENDLDIKGWKDLLAKTMHQANLVEKGLSWFIAEELDFLEKNWPEALPRAVVHTDLFPDNVFFKEEKVSGIIDFYFSCNELLAYDLALVVNAWCFDTGWDFQPERFDALLEGYQKERPLEQAEKDALSVLCRGAAVRILMTRLHDWLFHNPEDFVKPKDPQEYIVKLRFHQNA